MENIDNPNIKQEEDGQQNVSGNMYSYRDNNNSQVIQEGGAIRRSIGEGNPDLNNIQNNFGSGYGQNYINNGNVDIQYSQNIYYNSNNKSFSWETYLIFGIIEALIIVLLAIFFETKIKYKEDNILPGTNSENNSSNYGLLRDMNIMAFVGFGMLHTILRRNSWISISINILLIAISVQLALFFNYLWKIAFIEKFGDENFDLIYLMKAIFISSSVLITSGCVIGKISMIQYIILAIFETILSSLNYQLCETKLKVIDYGGALYIHTFGAIFGIAVSTVLFCSTKIKQSFQNYNYLNKSNYFSNITTFLGMIILFCYFPSFNSALAGKEKFSNIDMSTDLPYYMRMSKKFRQRGRYNTYFSLLGSVMGTFITSGFFNNGRFVFEEIIFGCISGAIIISGCSTVCLSFWGSIIIGTLGGIISVIFLSKIKPFFVKWGLKDTCNIILIHGINGLLGSLITPIIITALRDDEEIKTYLTSRGKLPKKQSPIQIGAIFITIGISFIGGIATGYLMKVSLCGKITQYFTDAEFFKEEENNIFDYVEPNTTFNIEISNPSLFKQGFQGYTNQKPMGPDLRGSQPSY